MLGQASVGGGILSICCSKTTAPPSRGVGRQMLVAKVINQ